MVQPTAERELQVADQRVRSDRQVAREHRLGDILQSCLDQMGQLLLDKDKSLLQCREGDEVRTLAHAQTLTVLERLDGTLISIVSKTPTG
jgi:hypothetical protein